MARNPQAQVFSITLIAKMESTTASPTGWVCVGEREEHPKGETIYIYIYIHSGPLGVRSSKKKSKTKGVDTVEADTVRATGNRDER